MSITKHFNLIAFVICIVTLFSCTNSNRHDWKDLNLKGEVKSVSGRKFRAEEKFGKIEKSFALSTDLNFPVDHIFENYKDEFDGEGKMLETSVYGRSGELSFKIIRSDTLYNCYFGDGNLRFKAIPNLPNKPTETSMYDKEGKLLQKVIYKYDESQNPIEETTYDSEGNIISSIKRKFLEDKPQNEVISVFGYDSKEISVDFKYDQNGNYSEINRTDITVGNQIDYSIKYEYDKEGNWTKATIYENSIPYSIVERTLEYFK